MMHRWRLTATVIALGLLTALAGSGTARANLAEYVGKSDAAFAWNLKGKRELSAGTVYELHLVSQVWQGITWEHSLVIYQPKDAAPNATMLLFNTGGAPRDAQNALALQLAGRIQAPVAFLYQIPNQPLFDGKKEDALIAETFVRYLETGDESWPLLFPMVKSLVKAMDALQAFGKQEWHKDVTGFVVGGASKRGWTSWLTAASGDPRVKAIVPMVIDTLNMQVQLPHQLKSFGAYSEMIKDYTERKLVPLPEGERARKLWGMVDPWIYRAKLTMPKFLINGANDPYWATDALNNYWDDLTGPKWIVYVPNAGHNLQRKDKGIPEAFAHVVGGTSAFVRAQITGAALPKLTWKHDDHEGQLRLTVQCDPPAAGGRLWVATAPTHDFRKAEWKEQPATVQNGQVTGTVAPPKEGCLAFYGELDYTLDGIPYHLSTQIRIADAGK